MVVLYSDRYGGLSLRGVLSKWHCRDNPLWLSCIRIGTGACPYGAFYRFDVTDACITDTFIPLARESQSAAGYGPGGHPKPEERDYSLAWEKEEK